MAKEEYIKRQERVRAQLPLNISNAIEVKEEEVLWYEPKLGETSRDDAITVLRIQQVTTDRTIPNSKTDIIIHHNEKRHVCYHKLQLQKTEICSRKKTQIFKKYIDLTIIIQGM